MRRQGGDEHRLATFHCLTCPAVLVPQERITEATRAVTDVIAAGVTAAFSGRDLSDEL